MQADRGGGNSTPRTGIPVSGCSPRPDLIPVPDSPTPSAQSPAEQQSEVNTHPLDPLCDRTYAPSQVPREDGTQYEKLSLGQLRYQYLQRGYWKEGSKSELTTRLPTIDAAEARRNSDEVERKDGERERAPAKGVKVSDKPMLHADLDGKRERAPARGEKDSDNPTQLSDSTRGGGNKDTLGSGKGKREQAPVLKAKDSDDPSTS